jgi:hypothetical protein
MPSGKGRWFTRISSTTTGGTGLGEVFEVEDGHAAQREEPEAPIRGPPAAGCEPPWHSALGMPSAVP